MNLNLQNHTALVCGSSQGIGRAAATELALLGARIILLARNEDALKVTCSELPTPNGQQHHYLAADFSNPAQVATVVDDFVNAGNPIHKLVNNN
ncbi:MAG: SDR family NAD(P)-dependent oxidoreductase [Bacteroidota bacterium]